MKITSIMSCVLILLCVRLSAQNNYHITGRFSFPDSTSVEMMYPHAAEAAAKAWTKNGQFVLEGTVDGPSEILLVISPPARPVQVRALYLDTGRIDIAGDTVLRAARISNSPINAEYERYQQIFQADPDEPVANKQRRYIAGHPNSFFSLLALQDLSAMQISNLDSVAWMYDRLGAGVRSTRPAIQFKEWMEFTRKLGPGNMLPDLKIKDLNGKTQTLSAFRGKYVLLHFWASWCPGCREQAPYFIDKYRQFSKNGLQVLYVSLDDKAHQDAWKKAIVSDSVGMFRHFSAELPDVYSSYHINGIPLNFLVDPAGRILINDVGTEGIEKALAPVFSKRS